MCRKEVGFVRYVLGLGLNPITSKELILFCILLETQGLFGMRTVKVVYDFLPISELLKKIP